MKLHRLIVLAACLVGIAGAAFPGPAGQGMFTDALAECSARACASAKQQALRSRLVTVDTSLLTDYTLLLNLFTDTAFEAVLDRLERRKGTSLNWIGHTSGDPDGQVVLTLESDALAGSITTSDGRLFSIRHAENGVHYVEELDWEAMLECGPAPQPIVGDVHGEELYTQSSDDGSLIDLLVVYTADARNAAGGHAGLRAQISNAVTSANLAYANSLVNQRLRLVGMLETDYAETGDAGTDLVRLATQNDGYMDAVHSWRNAYAADLVCLTVDNSNYGGIAYLMQNVTPGFASYAFSVVLRSQFPYQVLAHELGHNLGCHHDRENASGQGAYNYSYGYRFFSGGITRRTIMAYAPGVRISHFSNPSVQYQGVATGVPAGAPNSADNALTLNNTALTASGFRQSSTSTVARSISQAKMAANGTRVDMSHAVVSAVWPDRFYLSADDRSNGIQVRGAGTPSPGQRADVAGVVRTDVTGERYVEASVIAENGSGSVSPLMMTGRSLGGGDMFYNPSTGVGQKGVLGGIGVNNIGLLVSLAGRVVYVDPSGGFAYADDGSGVNDGHVLPGGVPGVRVLSSAVGADMLGRSVRLDGISTMELVNGESVRAVRATEVLAHDE